MSECTSYYVEDAGIIDLTDAKIDFVLPDLPENVTIDFADGDQPTQYSIVGDGVTYQFTADSSFELRVTSDQEYYFEMDVYLDYNSLFRPLKRKLDRVTTGIISGSSRDVIVSGTVSKAVFDGRNVLHLRNKVRILRPTDSSFTVSFHAISQLVFKCY